MMKSWLVFVTILSGLALGWTECTHQTNETPTVPQPGLISNQSKPQREIELRDLLIMEDQVSYMGFVVRKRTKRVMIDDGRHPPMTASASYITLQREGKTVMKFDGVYHPMGNGAEFGLVRLLSGEAEQLVVSLDVFRAGRQWIVDLEGAAHVIYDGNLWETGRETDDLGIVDLDGDGVYEITAPITDFYELNDKMSMSEIPLPEIIFKYDQTKRTYLPANASFREYALRNTLSSKEGSRDTDDAKRSDPISILLDYVYVGKQEAGWAIYDSRYRLSDKEEMRNRIKSILSREPVYEFIYNKRRNK